MPEVWVGVGQCMVTFETRHTSAPVREIGAPFAGRIDGLEKQAKALTDAIVFRFWPSRFPSLRVH